MPTATSTSTAGNPFLKPITSDNFDATLEWYFAGSRVGSFTIDGFVKNIHNYIYQNTHPAQHHQQRHHRRRGYPRAGELRRHGQGQGLRSRLSADLRFPAGPAQRLRPQRQLHLCDQQGHSELVPERRSAGPIRRRSARRATCRSRSCRSTRSTSQPFYEKGPMSIRVAYNWRSKFLLTESDVIFPYFPIWNAATGTLDASAFYTITPAHQDRRPGAEPDQRGDQDAAAVHARREARAAVLLHERPQVLVHPARHVGGPHIGPAATAAAATAASTAGDADVPGWNGGRGGCDLPGPSAAASASAAARRQPERG